MRAGFRVSPRQESSWGTKWQVSQAWRHWGRIKMMNSATLCLIGIRDIAEPECGGLSRLRRTLRLKKPVNVHTSAISLLVCPTRWTGRG